MKHLTAMYGLENLMPYAATGNRKLFAGDQVFQVIPSQLDESWTNPWTVERKCGPVTYEVHAIYGNKGTKIARLKSLNKFVEREFEIRRLTVLADPDTEEDQLGDKVALLHWNERKIVRDFSKRN